MRNQNDYFFYKALNEEIEECIEYYELAKSFAEFEKTDTKNLGERLIQIHNLVTKAIYGSIDSLEIMSYMSEGSHDIEVKLGKMKLKKDKMTELMNKMTSEYEKTKKITEELKPIRERNARLNLIKEELEKLLTNNKSFSEEQIDSKIEESKKLRGEILKINDSQQDYKYFSLEKQVNHINDLIVKLSDQLKRKLEIEKLKEKYNSLDQNSFSGEVNLILSELKRLKNLNEDSDLSKKIKDFIDKIEKDKSCLEELLRIKEELLTKKEKLTELHRESGENEASLDELNRNLQELGKMKNDLSLTDKTTLKSEKFQQFCKEIEDLKTETNKIISEQIKNFEKKIEEEEKYSAEKIEKNLKEVEELINININSKISKMSESLDKLVKEKKCIEGKIKEYVKELENEASLEKRKKIYKEIEAEKKNLEKKVENVASAVLEAEEIITADGLSTAKSNSHINYSNPSSF